MKIVTFNIQNKYKINNYRGIYRKKDTVLMLANYVKKNNIDILCTQELISSYKERLSENLDDYFCYGDFRFRSKLLLNLKKIRRFNESVGVFSNEKAFRSYTKKLPSLPDLLPRIMTVLEFKKFIVINTHLSAYNKISKKRQVKYILKFIKKCQLPIILTGDFNMNTGSNVLRFFIKELNKINIDHLSIKGRTFKKSKAKLPIDHVFISNSIKVNNIELVLDGEVNFSDHNPIKIDISI